jgi:hypothetical protein
MTLAFAAIDCAAEGILSVCVTTEDVADQPERDRRAAEQPRRRVGNADRIVAGFRPAPAGGDAARRFWSVVVQPAHLGDGLQSPSGTPFCCDSMTASTTLSNNSNCPELRSEKQFPERNTPRWKRKAENGENAEPHKSSARDQTLRINLTLVTRPIKFQDFCDKLDIWGIL